MDVVDGTDSNTAPVVDNSSNSGNTSTGSGTPYTSTVVDVTSPSGTTTFYDSSGNLIPSDQLGFDIYNPSTYPPGITQADLGMYF